MVDSTFNFRVSQHCLETICNRWPRDLQWDLYVYRTPWPDFGEKLSIWHSSVNERLYSCQSPGFCGSALGLLICENISWDGLGSLGLCSVSSDTSKQTLTPNMSFKEITLKPKSLNCNGILSKSYNGGNLPDWFGGILRQYRNHGLHHW